MKLYFFSIAFLFIISAPLFSQKEHNIWYFGRNAGLDFNTTPPTSLSDGKIVTQEGTAVQCDKETGALLFYTDGVTVWTKNHQVMTNGTDLNGGESSTQSALIVPNPANKFQYYIFTAPQQLSPSDLCYSIVSMETSPGEVISKNTLVFSGVSEQLTGTIDESNKGFWILTHSITENIFYSFHLTESGLDINPVISAYAADPTDNSLGYLRISPDTKKVALATYIDSALTLFDFDNATGIVTNPGFLERGGGTHYGVAFSRDNSKLYALAARLEVNGTTLENDATLYQYNLSLQDINAIRNSKTQITTGHSDGAIALAPDDKIYLNNFISRTLSVIDNPNVAGAGCGFHFKTVNLDGKCILGLPNFMDYHIDYNQNFTLDSVVYTICQGSDVQIGRAPSTGSTYSWTPIEGLDNPTISNPFASPTKTTEYISRRVSTSGSTYTQKFIVKVDSIEVKIAKVDTICFGGSAPLFASGGGTYLWTPSMGLSNPNISNPVATLIITTQYKVTVTKGQCVDSAFVTVPVRKLAADAGEDKTICPGGNALIGSEVSGDNYSWSPVTGLSNPMVANPTATPIQTTKYILEVRHDLCVAYDTVVVNVVSTLKASVSGDTTIFPGTGVQLTASGGSRYLWSPTKGLNKPNVSNPIASPDSTTRYKVIVSSGDCIDSAFVTVTVTPFSGVKVDSVQAICSGESVKLSASGGNTYSWYPSTGLDNPNIATPVATPITTTKYRVIVSSGNCIDTAFVTVNVGSYSGAKAGIDKTVCPGSSVVLGFPPEQGCTYSWLPATNLDDASKSNPTCTPISGSTQYILKVTSQTGCVGYDTVLVTVGTVKAKVSADTAICTGTSVQLSASGGSDYSWYPITGLDNPGIPNPIATISSSTTYRIIVSSGNCIDTAYTTVTVNTLPKANAGKDKTVCLNTPVKIGDVAIPGNTYSWQPSAGLDDASKSDPVVLPVTTTTYILTVTNQTGCSSFDTVLVSVGEIKAEVSSDTVSLCLGSSIQLFANGGSDYLWSPSEGLDNPLSQNPIASPNRSIVYKVIVSSGTCIDSAFVNVNVNQKPIADAGEDKIICLRESVQIGKEPSNLTSYTWTPTTGLSSPNQSLTDANPEVSTVYVLKAINSNGCENYDSVSITVNSHQEQLFTLTPSQLTIIPGQQFQVKLNVPNDVTTWKVFLDYDNFVVKFSSVNQKTNGIVTTQIDKPGQLTISGTGSNGFILIQFVAFLPNNSDSLFYLKLSVDSTSGQSCEKLRAIGSSTLQLSEICGKRFRMIGFTDKKYYLINQENKLNFGVGLQGKVTLDLYDNIGNLKQILVDTDMEAGEYSLDFDLPTGVYFCRMSAGMYNEVHKIVITK